MKLSRVLGGREISESFSLAVLDMLILPDDTYTFVSDVHVGTTSWIDHVLVSGGSLQACESMDVLYDFVTSDHEPISMVLNVGLLSRSHIIKPRAETERVQCNKMSNIDISTYRDVVALRLCSVLLPRNALICNGDCGVAHHQHTSDISLYYDFVFQCTIDAANNFEIGS